jgi:methylmalonyl-CoA mutase N-terminal domain/subunit
VHVTRSSRVMAEVSSCLYAVGMAIATFSERELTALRTAVARPDVNLMPNLLDCARAHATEGEIVGALQEVWGRYTELPVF